ncbi:hypothetical protein BJ170DRAFT_283477 [Xylariales sp. AK1849]|nr:hypothetical protein BJ170DRAFT_283477 [Xylariales sp. AK1849]
MLRGNIAPKRLFPLVSSIGAFSDSYRLGILGRIFPLWAGDHIGIFNKATLFILYGSVLVVALWHPGDATTDAVIPFTVLYGIRFGPFGLFAAMAALISQI